MARDISEIRARRRNKSVEIDRNRPASTPTNTNLPTSDQLSPKLDTTALKGDKKGEKSTESKSFLRNFFRRKFRPSKVEKFNAQLSKSNFKPIVLSLYVLVFFTLIIACLVYVVNQESKYETKVATSPNKAGLSEEQLLSSPLIDDSDEESEEEEDSIPQGFSAVIDNQTYTIESVLPNNLTTQRFDLGGFLNFIANNRANFCKYAEQTRMAYILANGEVRNYSTTSYPLPNNKFDYADCMSTGAWQESELFSLYQNLYEDFINTNSDDEILVQKLENAKNYQLNVNFNPVRDFPLSLSGALLSEEDFSEVINRNYANKILLCDYSNKFARAYDMFVSKRNGSLRPISNCYADNMNMQEAYVQYSFYHSYIQPNSQDANADLLHSALIPNYTN